MDREALQALEAAADCLARARYVIALTGAGLSVESGLPIPDERLEARPTAELTVEEERARGE